MNQQDSQNDIPNYPLDFKQWKKTKVYGMDFREDLLDMAQTTTRLGLWGWFKTDNPPENTGYMYWEHENVNKISDGLTCNYHSGATFSHAMRIIQYIAKNGFEKWNNPPHKQPE